MSEETKEAVRDLGNNAELLDADRCDCGLDAIRTEARGLEGK